MNKETKLLIGEILNLAEGNGQLWAFLDTIDVSDTAYKEAKQDFNKTKTQETRKR